MNIFLKLKHWQLFAMIFFIIAVFETLTVGSLMESHNVSTLFWAFPLMMLSYMGILFGWYYSMGTNLYPKLPESTNMSLGKFKLFMAIPFFYIILICIGFGSVPLVRDHLSGWEPPHALFLLIPLVIGLHLFSMFGIFYTMWFVAKALKSVELQRPAVSDDFIGEFFMLWFFPVGIWFIQPRINKMFAEAPIS